jgi:hypothetical protein
MSKKNQGPKIYDYQLMPPSEKATLYEVADLVIEERDGVMNIVKNRHGAIGTVVTPNKTPRKSKSECFSLTSTLSKSGTKEDMFFNVTLKHVMDNGQVAFGEGSAPVKDLAEWMAFDSFRRDFAVKLTTSSGPLNVKKMPVYECDQNGQPTGEVETKNFDVPPGWGKVTPIVRDKKGIPIVAGCKVKIVNGAFCSDALYFVDEVHASNSTVVVRYVEPGGTTCGVRRPAFIADVEVIEDRAIRFYADGSPVIKHPNDDRIHPDDNPTVPCKDDF